MWQKKKVSVILPTYNEKLSIKKSIRDLEKLKIIDEIIVVNNNAIEGTSGEVRQTIASEIFEPRQGYGAAIRRGLSQAGGDYLIISEPDGTFVARDIYKFLSYAADFEVVLGTRTTNSLIWEGANMGFFLKWGNYLVGKLTEVLFNTTQLTDAGCTYRLIKRPVYRKIKGSFSGFGSDFGLEMLLVIIQKGIPFIQIPVNYRQRVGESSVTGNPLQALLLGLQMVLLILRKRFIK